MLPSMKPESLLMWRQPAEESKLDISVMTGEVRISMMDHHMFPVPHVGTGYNHIHYHRHESVDPMRGLNSLVPTVMLDVETDRRY